MSARWFVSMSAAIPAALLASDAPPAPTADPVSAMPAEVEVRTIDSLRLELYGSGDRESLPALVDEDFRYTGANGDWLSKREFVDLQQRSPRAEIVRAGDPDIRTFGDVAVVLGAFSYLDTARERVTTRYTDVYRRDGRAWHLINEQHSLVADPSQVAMIRETGPFHAPWRGVEPSGYDDDVLHELNKGYVQAFLDSNVAWYDAHLASDYLVVFGDGSLQDKGSLLAAAAHPVTNMQSFPTTSVTVRRFGDVALIHAENPYVRTDGLRGVNRYTDLWHKRDGRWMCIGAHVTRHKLPS
jgi:ketosteroid isomerase-like protein